MNAIDYIDSIEATAARKRVSSRATEYMVSIMNSWRVDIPEYESNLYLAGAEWANYGDTQFTDPYLFHSF